MESKKGKAKLIVKYLKQYPDTRDYTISKKIYSENKHIFTSLEEVRSTVRYYRGHSGEAKRKQVKSEFITPLNWNTKNNLTYVNRETKLKVFTLPKAHKEVLFLSDIHFPYQNEEALVTALRYGYEKKVDAIWLNGDILDMYHASDHEKLPNESSIHEEFEQIINFFEYLRSVFPTAKIYYKEGNHERRWMRFLMRKASELLGSPEFELPNILRLAEYGVTWIENETLVKFGKLNVIHGNEFKGGGGVNPARALYMKAKANVIAGDKHKTGENTEGNLDGKIVTTWSVGCLCELNPKYLPFAHVSWNHGFAHISMSGNDFHVQNFRIYNGKML